MVTRTGRALVKGNKTDKVFQDILVQEHDDGTIEYYHPQFFKWCALPEEWRERIVWQNVPATA